MAKKETRFLGTKRLFGIRTECSAETTLPDFNTDVRKILHVSAKPHPISSFASADGIECSGEVTFDVVYLDFEGAVCSASFSGDYSFNARCDTETYKDSLVETSLGSLSLRLMSPRKLAARATLESNLTVITEKVVSVDGDALATDMNPQIEPVSVLARSTAMTPSAEREYAASLVRFDGKTTDEVSLLHLSVTPVLERIEVSDGVAELSGHIDVSALIKTDEYPIHKLEKSLELSEKIPLGDIDADGDIRAAIEVVSATTAVNGDEGGVEIALGVITETRLVGDKNASLEFYSDVYLCDFPCECIRERVNYDEYLGRWSAACEISESVPLSHLGVGKIREIVYADAEVRGDAVEMTSDGATVSGEIFVSAIATEINDGSVELVPLKFSVKFSKNVNCNCQKDEKIALESDVSLSGVSVTVDSSSVYFSSVIRAEVALCRHLEVDVVNSANAILSEPYSKNAARVSVHYPSSEETLYSIAKAYHTTRERILSDNPGASEAELSSIKRLIIT